MVRGLRVLVRLRPVCARARVSRLASRVPGLGEWNVACARVRQPGEFRLGWIVCGRRNGLRSVERDG